MVARKPPKTRPVCGTVEGYRRHRGAGEVTCDRCKEANAAYMREYRSRPEWSGSKTALNDSKRRAAQRAAVRRLIQEYAQRYEELVAEELSLTER